MSISVVEADEVERLIKRYNAGERVAEVVEHIAGTSRGGPTSPFALGAPRVMGQAADL